MIQRAAEHPNIIGVAQVGGQSRLSRLILEVASQVGPTQSATQVLFLVAEEVLRHVVGSLDDCDNRSLLIAAESGVRTGDPRNDQGILQ